MSKGNQYRLWTPIANAFEAYRRRLIIEPKAFYEHTWRLVHIQESLIVTLGSSLATRLLSIWKEQQDAASELKSLQELVTGRNQDDNDSSNESANRGCLGGNIGAWIDLLNRFGRSEIKPVCPFIASIKTYLEAVPESVTNNDTGQEGKSLAFLSAWRRIAPVQNTFLDNNLSRIGRFNAINSLRNKLAHVPISGRILEELHTGLRYEIISLLTSNTNWQKNHATTDLRFSSGWHAPLCGQIGNKAAYVTGSDFGQSSEENTRDTLVYFKWCQSNDAEPIIWSASPFVHFDDELKVSLLFRLQRLDDERDLPGEYYRFAAEVEPVQVRMISQDIIAPWLRADIYSSSQELNLENNNIINENNFATDDLEGEIPDYIKQLKEEPYELRSKAEQAFKDYKYPLAVRYFDALAESSESLQYYNDVAMSKHGAALWRTANRKLESGIDRDKQISEMQRAIDLLNKAAQHRDVAYQARSLYEKSKALWHLLDFVDKPSLLDEATQDAKKAAELGYNSAYISWYQKLLETPRTIIEASTD